MDASKYREVKSPGQLVRKGVSVVPCATFSASKFGGVSNLSYLCGVKFKSSSEMDKLALVTLICLSAVAAIAGIAVLYDMYSNHKTRVV